MTIDLSTKTALITGASRGIGEATARKFAELGANVVLAARSSGDVERIAAEIGAAATSIRCDVSSYDDMVAAVSLAQSRFGRLDILVNNAGLIEPIARIEDSDPEAWGNVVDVNLKGVYHGLRAAHPAMRDNGGLVINLSSGAAGGLLEGWSHYCATKAAVLALTRNAHNEWSGQGINVVGLSPGTVATGMQTAIKDSGINPVSQMEWSDHIPVEWVAQAIAWLTTPAASKHYGNDFSLKTPEGLHEVGLGT
ncbi:MAG: SDR family oxidoreductase [Actinobacteria bacterium]|nr:SDR family oxidoreductase [Actinomycetota bacterium]